MAHLPTDMAIVLLVLPILATDRRTLPRLVLLRRSNVPVRLTVDRSAASAELLSIMFPSLLQTPRVLAMVARSLRPTNLIPLVPLLPIVPAVPVMPAPVPASVCVTRPPPSVPVPSALAFNVMLYEIGLSVEDVPAIVSPSALRMAGLDILFRGTRRVGPVLSSVDRNLENVPLVPAPEAPYRSVVRLSLPRPRTRCYYRNLFAVVSVMMMIVMMVTTTVWWRLRRP